MKAIARRPRVYEANTFVDGWLPPELSEWPANLQDEVYGLIEKLLETTDIKAFEIIQAVCYQDEPGPLWQVKITIMESLGPEDVRIVH